MLTSTSINTNGEVTIRDHGHLRRIRAHHDQDPGARRDTNRQETLARDGRFVDRKTGIVRRGLGPAWCREEKAWSCPADLTKGNDVIETANPTASYLSFDVFDLIEVGRSMGIARVRWRDGRRFQGVVSQLNRVCGAGCGLEAPRGR